MEESVLEIFFEKPPIDKPSLCLWQSSQACYTCTSVFSLLVCTFNIFGPTSL